MPTCRPSREKTQKSKHTPLEFPETRENEGAWLRTIRENLGFSQATLAQKLMVERVEVIAWENGRSRPSAAALVEMGNIAGHLGRFADTAELWQAAGVDMAKMRETAAIMNWQSCRDLRSHLVPQKPTVTPSVPTDAC